jgi:hypothetical protein
VFIPGAVTISGATNLQSASAQTLNVSVSGATSLASTTSQTLTVTGDTVLQGKVTLSQAQGDISMGAYN